MSIGDTFVEMIAKGLVRLEEGELVGTTLTGRAFRRTSGEALRDHISKNSVRKFVSQCGNILRSSRYYTLSDIHYKRDVVYPILEWDVVVLWIDFLVEKGSEVQGVDTIRCALSDRLDGRIITHLIEKYKAPIHSLAIESIVQERDEPPCLKPEFREYILKAYFSQTLNEWELRHWVDYLCVRYDEYDNITGPRLSFKKKHEMVFLAMFRYAPEQCLTPTLRDKKDPTTIHTFVQAVAKKNLDAWRFLVWNCGFPNTVRLYETVVHNGTPRQQIIEHTCT